MATRQPTAKAGKVLGRYRIERELGRGGMGVVYLARDQNLQRRVALKTTSVAGLGSSERSRTQRRKRFIREVQALAQVSHENVVHVYDANEQDDPELGWLLFYSMQFVDGITLAQLVQSKGAMDPAAAAAVCVQVALGLGAAHKKNIVHRDVKPANIFLTSDRRALIGDFGICKIEGSTQITRRDQLVGTPNYLAPEQILGDPVTPATDVFALAALFYVVTANRPLRTKVDPASLMASANTDAAREKVMREKRIPQGLRQVVARALSQNPADRYPDGDALAEALSEHATRIPRLGEESDPRQPAPMQFSTDTDPFAPIGEGEGNGGEGEGNGGEGEGNGGAAIDAIEAAARALLSEVKTQGPPRVPAQKKQLQDLEPLPVAQAESTVMFQLREVERDKAAQRAELEALPVARSEATVVHQMRQPAPKVYPTSGPLAEDTMDATPPDTQDLPAPRAKPRKPKKRKKSRRPLPPLDTARWRAIGITAAASFGFALFLVVLIYALGTPGAPDIPPPRL